MRMFAVAAAALLFLSGVASAAELEIPKGGFVVSSDVSLLPEAVAAKRAALLAAAETGDIAALKAIFDKEPAPPMVSFGLPDDAIAHLKDESADGQGIETLAVLHDILSAPYAAVDGGDREPFYMWPYLAAYESLAGLEPKDLVRAYSIMGYAGFEEMRELDAWYYWRALIGPKGELQAFIAGD